MTFFGKLPIGSPKNPDLNGKSQVNTKLSESFCYIPYLSICNHKTCWWIYTPLALRWSARFTTNGIRAKKNTIYMRPEQAIIKWSYRVGSIVACCQSVKICALAARAFRSQQNGTVTRMWRSCRVKPSQKELAIGVVRCKKEGMLL